MYLYFVKLNVGGGFDYSRVWEKFFEINVIYFFDIVYLESVVLFYWKVFLIEKFVVLWYGI